MWASILLIIIASLNVSASSYAQGVSLSLKNASLEQAFDAIKQQTGYTFLYRDEWLAQSKKLTLKLQNAPVITALQECFRDQPFTYEIIDKTVVVKQKTEATPIVKNFSPPITVTGRVTGEKGEPLPGVSVAVKGTSSGTVTNANGNFSLEVPSANAFLVFSFMGYIAQEMPVKEGAVMQIILKEDQKKLDEVVVVGYGTQKKITLTGSVATVSSKEIVTTKNQNVQNMLTGKVPGLRVKQNTSEPGDFTNQFDIRGFGAPLLVVDGVPRGDLARMDPNEIESISVLKDAAAAIYGVRAANGVVLITTKRGDPGKARIEYSFYYGLQNPTGLPKPLGALDRFTIFNEQSMHNLNSPRPTFTDDIIKPYRDGTKQSTDWYGMVMRNNAPQSYHNLSASGSAGDKVDYFINLGYTDQGGFWKSNSLKYKRYNLRANINAMITPRIKASLKLNGILDEKNSPNRDSWEIFKNLWRSHPDDPYYANDNPQYLYHNLADYHPGAIADADISGFKLRNSKTFQSTFSLDYKVPYVEGLMAKGMFSYDATMNDNSTFQKIFTVYDYNATTDFYQGYKYQIPNQINRNYAVLPSTLMQFSLNYTHTFAKKHNVDLLALYEESVATGDGFYATRELTIPLPYLFAGNSLNQVGSSNTGSVWKNSNKGFVGRFNYDYNSKYLMVFSFRYDGSSKFPPGKQWGFFPSIMGGWRISEEGFMKNNPTFSFINNLKLRGSYGITGDDGASSYQFISGYDYPFGGNSQALAGGYQFEGSWVSALGFRNAPNMNITWFESKQVNLGLDAELWKGLLGVTFDIFRRDRSGLLANRLLSLPGSFGANLPQENLNSDQTEGFEFMATHRNRIGRDFSYSLTGNISLTRTKNMYIERAREGNSYNNWRNNNANRYNDVWFGWGYEGQYQSYDQIAKYPIYTGRAVLPGDYIYEDWNHDGVIDDMDRYPIATTINPGSDFNGKRNYPLLNYGFTLSADYKGIDLNMLFQGGGMSYSAYGEMYQTISQNALDFFMDRWHPEDPTKDPYDPSNKWIPGYNAYTGTVYDINSERGIQNCAYLRIKSIELGYSLPNKLLNRVGIQSLRFFVNGYNLVTFTNAVGVDPEHPSELYGYLYPLNKTVNFGASIKF
ncbi:SusC/RagA family TonB-linked outer membrane protein [Chitinophaga sp. SYP-B3965]|uniref:TonB-dependent receptor n=1 Tax=Chitinophaga sp. SYP-B3965 TaxID=2663120 RepID=UPI001299CBBA|nr:TonB-dependent receptor [Chitinophaga sp. SYP-B3965]MRG47532.1 SusC/RagA family TonB-linked outer membrane protein [Chitinophaga sp. SYP-B3965]